MYSCISASQLTYKPSTSIRHTRDWPLQLAVGLTVHQSFRSEKIEFLHVLGISVADRQALTLLVCFVALRPKSTSMVMAGRSVHLTALFLGMLEQTVNQYFVRLL